VLPHPISIAGRSESVIFLDSGFLDLCPAIVFRCLICSRLFPLLLGLSRRHPSQSSLMKFVVPKNCPKRRDRKRRLFFPLLDGFAHYGVRVWRFRSTEYGRRRVREGEVYLFLFSMVRHAGSYFIKASAPVFPPFPKSNYEHPLTLRLSFPDPAFQAR